MNSVKPVWFFSGLYLVSVFFSKRSETHLQFWKHSLNIWRPPRAGLVLVCGFLSLVPLCWFNHFFFQSYFFLFVVFIFVLIVITTTASIWLWGFVLRNVWKTPQKIICRHWIHRETANQQQHEHRNHSLHSFMTEGCNSAPPGSEQEAGFGGQLEDS